MQNNDSYENSTSKEESELPIESIKEMGALKAQSGIEVISIIGQIEGHFILNDQSKTTKYEHLLPALVSIEENPDVSGLLILINTVGGDVEAGLAIAELIASMSKPTVSIVLGGGHSIGVPLAVASDVSFIVPSATMTIHPVRTNGVIIGVPQSFNNFERMQKRITGFVTANSKISEKRFNELLSNIGELVTDVGTTLDGQQAVNEGLIDRIGGLHDAIIQLKELCGKNKGNDNQLQRHN